MDMEGNEDIHQVRAEVEQGSNYLSVQQLPL
jgi:hypothetical protein